MKKKKASYDVELHALCSHVVKRLDALGLGDFFEVETEWPPDMSWASSFDGSGTLKHGLLGLRLLGECLDVHVFRDEDSLLTVCVESVHSYKLSVTESPAGELRSRFHGAVVGRLLADAPVPFGYRTFGAQRWKTLSYKYWTPPFPEFTDELATEILTVDAGSSSAELRQWVILHLAHPLLTATPAPTEERL